ncbi:sorbose reductase sou1 [Rhizoctonia solani 123E]|uniref:Sorbose reductase sou1 n=1 Tax=Rhizoctonia solani 123E TaxID=1423351 RepID=A0A074RF20_9AGAM|nr:sorbose reductase sou1 [Rhizoctonia solani 123E]
MRSTTQTPLVGVAAALQVSSDPSFTPKKTLFDKFSLQGRVGVVTGGNRGIGLEMALALCEAGATVYALDLPDSPGEEFIATAEYAKKLGSTLKYVSIDVTDQKSVWDKIKAIAAGQQMTRFGTPGSIIPMASISGSATNRVRSCLGAYNTSKSAVLQMTRSLACELGKHKIRVNSISPGYIYTKMTAAYLDSQPGLEEKWSNLNPLGRIGRPDELRGVTAWLASDASTFCTGSDIIVSGGHLAW